MVSGLFNFSFSFLYAFVVQLELMFYFLSIVAGFKFSLVSYNILAQVIRPCSNFLTQFIYFIIFMKYMQVILQ